MGAALSSAASAAYRCIELAVAALDEESAAAAAAGPAPGKPAEAAAKPNPEAGGAKVRGQFTPFEGARTQFENAPQTPPTGAPRSLTPSKRAVTPTRARAWPDAGASADRTLRGTGHGSVDAAQDARAVGKRISETTKRIDADNALRSRNPFADEYIGHARHAELAREEAGGDFSGKGRPTQLNMDRALPGQVAPPHRATGTRRVRPPRYRHVGPTPPPRHHHVVTALPARRWPQC